MSEWSGLIVIGIVAWGFFIHWADERINAKNRQEERERQAKNGRT